MKIVRLITGVIALMTIAQTSYAMEPTKGEMQTAHQWAVAKFQGVQPKEALEAGLLVLENHGPVQLNARGNEPLRIGSRNFQHGLYCHAPSRVVVRLPSPGREFASVIGVDARAGGGSVVFSVSVASKEAFNSGVRHIGDSPLPISVDLHGATEFVLAVGDAGDGITSDQADWADAAVTLENGKSIRLGDLPFGGKGSALTSDPPFSFIYDGKPFDPKAWKVERASKKLDDNRIQHTLIYTEPKGLQVRCVGIEYTDFPTVEWTLYLKNTGESDTPVISDIQALDLRLERTGQGDFILHHHAGTTVTPRDFEPLETKLESGESIRFAPPGGRPLGVVFPYFNLQWENQGMIAVVGWPGQWAAEFTPIALGRELDSLPDDQVRGGSPTPSPTRFGGLRIKAGQELTKLTLHPGEEIRTPLIVLQFYTGDPVRSQNIWRRWMIAHSLPRYGGKLPQPIMPEVSGNHFPGLLCNEKDEILFLDRYLENGIKPDYWWMDAGWYPNKGSWSSVGTWEVDKTRFPGGLRAVSDYARERGIKTMVWFEPERVTPGSWLYDTHPEWLLGADGGTKLLDLGNPEARKWVTDHTDKLMTEQGIDAYRQDYNVDPLSYWRANDAANRQGITENHYVTGYLAFWDELRHRRPDMLIDSCASGGHRNDLETMRRSVPLLRSDYIFDPVGEQCHTYGLASWLPFYGTGFIKFDTYIFRSTMCPNTTLGPDVRRTDIDWPLLRKLIGEWRQVVDYYYGDFYPLTKYSLEYDQWMAWQFDRPDLGAGMVQAFRRPNSAYELARFKLQGLDPEARYKVSSFDSKETIEATGKDLMETGYLVTLRMQPEAAVIVYKRK